jgi:hypothetical protein
LIRFLFFSELFKRHGSRDGTFLARNSQRKKRFFFAEHDLIWFLFFSELLKRHGSRDGTFLVRNSQRKKLFFFLSKMT